MTDAAEYDVTPEEASVLAVLRASLEVADPPPVHVLEMAKAVPSLAQLDAEIAELVESEQAVRDDGPDSLIFVAELATVVVHFDDVGPAVEVIGTDDTANVVVHTADGSTHDLVPDGPLNRLAGGVSGPVKIVVSPPNARSVATTWFTLQ